LPDGLNRQFPVKARTQKYSDLQNPQISLYLPPSRPFGKGRFAIVTNAGRDAVDAEVSQTYGTKADGKAVWS
jgi:hypothetical protein